MKNVADALCRHAAVEPDRTALVFEDRAWTFRNLRDDVERYAAGLASVGFVPGDKLGLMLANRPEFIALEYAAFMLGGIVMPLNIHYRSGEIEHVLGTCEVDLLVAEAEYADRIAPDIRRRCPALRAVFLMSPTAGARHDLVRPADVLVGEPGRVAGPVARDQDDVALMLHTSATTGKAKGVMLTLGNLEANYDRSPEWLGVSGRDVILCALPLYNTFALNQCINAMMVTGATMVLLRRFDAATASEAVERHRCTFFPAVPAMLQKMLNDPESARRDLSSLARICVGGAPVPAPLLARVYERIGRDTVVMTGYGLTEATALVSLHRATMNEQGELHRAKSVGPSLPGIRVAIMDDAGREVPSGTVGEICIQGPNVMKGYYGRPEETRTAIVDGWLHTGDLGAMDPDGFFSIVDRKKDLIIRGGQNIYPADVEEVLYRHPSVAEAAVVAVPDDVMGEVPAAFVAPKPGMHVAADELSRLCKGELAYFKVPASIEILPELPKGPTGKILRRALRESRTSSTTGEA